MSIQKRPQDQPGNPDTVNPATDAAAANAPAADAAASPASDAAIADAPADTTSTPIHDAAGTAADAPDPAEVKEKALRKSAELLRAARAEQTRAARVAQRRGMDHPRRTPLRTLDQSHKLKNVLYDIRGPVTTLAEQMEADGHRIMIGNAAQALHPVAGQGLNLGLRDAFELAQALGDAGHGATALREACAAHARARRRDRLVTVGVTDRLAVMFASPVVRGAASVVLSALGFSGIVYGLSSLGESAGETTAMPPWIPLVVGAVAPDIIPQVLP